MATQILNKAIKIAYVKTVVVQQETINYDAPKVAFAGGGQANATQLQDTINVVGTVASSGDSVILPNLLEPGIRIAVTNQGASSMNIYPPVGGYFNNVSGVAQAINAPIAITNGQIAEFVTIVSYQGSGNYYNFIIK